MRLDPKRYSLVDAAAHSSMVPTQMSPCRVINIVSSTVTLVVPKVTDRESFVLHGTLHILEKVELDCIADPGIVLSTKTSLIDCAPPV